MRRVELQMLMHNWGECGAHANCYICSCRSLFSETFALRARVEKLLLLLVKCPARERNCYTLFLFSLPLFLFCFFLLFFMQQNSSSKNKREKTHFSRASAAFFCAFPLSTSARNKLQSVRLSTFLLREARAAYLHFKQI